MPTPRELTRAACAFVLLAVIGLGAAPVAADSPTDFFSLPPCRVIDTRNPAGPLGGPALVGGGDRVFPVAGTCGIPADAQAIAVNIAVTGATTSGNLRLHAGGTPVPLVSAINYSSGQTRSNNAVVPLSPAGELAVFASGGPADSAHLILDVDGYFAPTPCDPDGVYVKSGSPITYTCCSGLVDVNVTQFTFSMDGAAVTPSPTGPAMTGSSTTCPSGSFNNAHTDPGGCTITYGLAGSFTSAQSWSGTYSLSFMGMACDCSGGQLGTPCINQTYPMTATR